MQIRRRARRGNSTIIRNFIFTAILAALLLLLGFFPHLVETIYSNGFYRVTSVVQRFLSSVLPFALGDFLYFSLILYVLFKVFLFFRKLFKKQLRKSSRWKVPLQALQFLLLLYIIFKLSWGLNYSRLPIAASLGISNQKYTQPELLALGNFLIKKVNALQPKRVKNPKWTIQKLEEQAAAAYQNVAQEHPFFNYIAPAVKPVLFSEIITRLGIEGYYNPLSGEANVNMHLPPTGQAFVSCHEIAHQLGIGREDEANLIGYLAAIHSNNLEFQYSGYYAMLRSVMVEIGKSMPEIYDVLYYTVNKRTISEFERDRAFWLKYNSEMYAYMDISFDKFLKLNNQQKGTESYQDIVLWLYNYHKKEL
jgi:hypothetical protein